MWWRIIFVLLLFLIPILSVIFFSDSIFPLLEQIWKLDADQRDKIVDWAKVLATAIALFTAISAAIGLVYRFVRGKRETEQGVDTGGGALFNDKVNIRGDFINGDKNVIAGRRDDDE